MEILNELRIRITELINRYDAIEKESQNDSFKRMDALSKKIALLQFLYEINEIESLEMKKYHLKRSVKELNL